MRTLTVGTRGSALALRQTNWVVNKLKSVHPALQIQVQIVKTKGDKILDVPLAKIGDKGLFVTELENALLGGEIDFAVHSMKDLPAEMPSGLRLSAVPERADPSDVLITNGPGLADLPVSAKVGSGSLRRRAQLLSYRPDLEICDLRGNLDTRLRKLDSGEFDAIVLAYAGLYRMGWTERITEKIPLDICLPAVGQGALAVQSRDDDAESLSLLAAIDHASSHSAIRAERGFMRELEGGCQVPVGALACISGDRLLLKGIVACPNGLRLIRGEMSGGSDKPEEIGVELARILLSEGASEILHDLRNPEY
jgi:hydroxymethylbilane synthase